MATTNSQHNQLISIIGKFIVIKINHNTKIIHYNKEYRFNYKLIKLHS